MTSFPENLGIAELASVMDALHDEIWIYDDNYNLLYVNKACERHYGFTRGEILAMSFTDAIYEHRAWSNAVLPLVYKHERAVRQQQVTFLGFHTLLIASPVFDGQGKLSHVVMINRECCNELDVPLVPELESELGDDVRLLSPSELDENFEGVNPLAVQELARKMAKVSAPCLLLGESGSGKTFLARYIHEHSNRVRKPFIVISCPSIPHELFESELFGHVKGAFSGAVSSREGLFAQAEGGTLLLDEVSELPMAMQAKLLHVLQENEFRPVGSTRVFKSDVRILAATNRNLERMVEHKLFRQDLYFRLHVLDITLPPLRERGADILNLVNYYLKHFGKKYNKWLELCEPALSMLLNYSWPGNIRELKNVIERAVIRAEGHCLEARHLPLSMYSEGKSRPDAAPEPQMAHPGGAAPGYPELKPVPRQRDPRTEEAFPCLPCRKPGAPVDAKILKDLYLECRSSRKLAQALGVSQSTASRLIRKYITAEV